MIDPCGSLFGFLQNTQLIVIFKYVCMHANADALYRGYSSSSSSFYVPSILTTIY